MHCSKTYNKNASLSSKRLSFLRTSFHVLEHLEDPTPIQPPPNSSTVSEASLLVRLPILRSTRLQFQYEVKRRIQTTPASKTFFLEDCHHKKIVPRMRQLKKTMKGRTFQGQAVLLHRNWPEWLCQWRRSSDNKIRKDRKTQKSCLNPLIFPHLDVRQRDSNMLLAILHDHFWTTFQSLGRKPAKFPASHLSTHRGSTCSQEVASFFPQMPFLVKSLIWRRSLSLFMASPFH